MRIATIGLDLAKSVFQAHGVDENGATVLVKKLHRKQMLPFFSKLSPCLIGIEACVTAHYWARTLAEMGHEVRSEEHTSELQSLMRISYAVFCLKKITLIN